MTQSQNNVSVQAPGFMGLNTQDSPVGMDISFAAIADNCVIDKFGRIGSRKGFQVQTTNYSALNGEQAEQIFHFTSRAGVEWLFVCGNNKIFTQQLAAPFELQELTLPQDYPSITDNNWSICTLSDWVYFVQAGHTPLKWNDGTADVAPDPSPDPTLLYEWTEDPVPSTGPPPGAPNVNLAAFGHQFCAAFDGNKSILVWSDLLIGDIFTTATAGGSIDLTEVWPFGYDEVTALYAHNNFLIVFGQQSILVFNVPEEGPVYANLQDTITGIGCIARDTVVGIGGDVLFLDATGVRSLGRTIQEKSVPIGDVSINVRTDIKKAIEQSQAKRIKAVYAPDDSFYGIFFPDIDLTYIFDTRITLENGAYRPTRWPNLGITCSTRSTQRRTWFAGRGGVYLYQGAEDLFPDIPAPFGTIPSPREDGEVVLVPIEMRYFTNPQDFGQPVNLKFPKQLDLTIIGSTQLLLGIFWSFDWGTNDNNTTYSRTGGTAAQYNIAEYNTDAEYSGGESLLTTEQFNLWGSGRNVDFGFVCTVQGSPFSIQELNIQALTGRIV